MRRIRMDDDMLSKILNSLQKMLIKDSMINITVPKCTVGEKAALIISEKARMKMSGLVFTTDKEVAWHGVCHRGKESNQFYIDDIVLYPQTVTGATVSTDQVKYQEWLFSNSEEVYKNLRMQGHSHVNMGVSPSGVDRTYYNGIVDELPEDDYYIFLIINKKMEMFVEIWDKRENVFYENSDIETFCPDGEYHISSFVESTKEMVVEKKPDKPSTTKKYPWDNTVNTPVKRYDDHDYYANLNYMKY